MRGSAGLPSMPTGRHYGAQRPAPAPFGAWRWATVAEVRVGQFVRVRTVEVDPSILAHIVTPDGLGIPRQVSRVHVSQYGGAVTVTLVGSGRFTRSAEDATSSPIMVADPVAGVAGSTDATILP